MVYLVTWNLNKEGTAYTQARARLMEKFDALNNVRREPNLETVRFVSTNLTAEDLFNRFQSVLDGNDTMFISKVHRGDSEKSGKLTQDTWNWLKANL